MKKIIMGLIALTSISSFASTSTSTSDIDFCRALANAKKFDDAGQCKILGDHSKYCKAIAYSLRENNANTCNEYKLLSSQVQTCRAIVHSIRSGNLNKCEMFDLGQTDEKLCKAFGYAVRDNNVGSCDDNL